MAAVDRLGPRIIVIGRPGSGKTSLATELSFLLRRKVFTLDRFVRDDKHRRRPPDEIASAMTDVARGQEWIVEGAPWVVPPHAWRGATAVIWLDPPRFVTAWRVFRRAFPNRLMRRRVWGLIRYTLLADMEARERQRRFVDDFTPAGAEVIRLTSSGEYRWLVESIASSS